MNLWLALVSGLLCATTSSVSLPDTTSTGRGVPVVYTIAGSDSGGGAGIQADLHAIHSMGCHGCSAITCLTAQNSVGVAGVHAPPASFLSDQIDCLLSDMPPRAIKIGMLGTAELTMTVAKKLREIKDRDPNVWVVLDPVMVSTSGSKLLDRDAVAAMKEHLFPFADIVTPNLLEAEELLGRKLTSTQDIADGAKQLLALGCKAVLIKGGHVFAADSSPSNTHADDYLVSVEDPMNGEERLCDGRNGVWIRSTRWDTENTHGTGCTLSSAIAASLSLGEEQRKGDGVHEGATEAIGIVDACCLAKAYVSQGIRASRRVGQGPGPVAQTSFPTYSDHFPWIVQNPNEESSSFLPLKSSHAKEKSKGGTRLGKILPIVDSVEWVEKLAQKTGITDIQLRIKDERDSDKILERVVYCQNVCAKHGVRLWINDHWEAAVTAGCFGVHIGQEDLFKCAKAGGLTTLKAAKVALGISTHSYAELSAALGVKPSYISMGPVFQTASKKVQFHPQGLRIVRRWRNLIPESVPFVTIGGINDAKAATLNRKAGADCVAVIGAITNVDDVQEQVALLNQAME